MLDAAFDLYRAAAADVLERSCAARARATCWHRPRRCRDPPAVAPPDCRHHRVLLAAADAGRGRVRVGQPDRRGDLPRRAPGTFDRKAMELLPGRYTWSAAAPASATCVARSRSCRGGRARGRDPLRGGSERAPAAVRGTAGERAFESAQFPVSIGGTGSDIVVPGLRAPAARWRGSRCTRTSCIRAAGDRRGAIAAQRRARVTGATWLRRGDVIDVAGGRLRLASMAMHACSNCWPAATTRDAPPWRRHLQRGRRGSEDGARIDPAGVPARR